MDYILFCLAWIFGGFIGAFTVGQCLILIRFGIPTAIQWYRKGWITVPTPISRYVISFIILTIIFIGISWLVIEYFPKYMTAYFVGVSITFFFSISRSGESTDNIADFVQVNLQFINHAEIEKLTKELGVDNILLHEKPNDENKSA